MRTGPRGQSGRVRVAHPLSVSYVKTMLIVQPPSDVQCNTYGGE